MNILLSPFSALYSKLRILSLDIALGGVVFSNSLAYIYGHHLPFGVTLSLFCAIWLIYTLDHLIDANKRSQVPSMARHQFHRKYKKPILAAMIFVLVVGVFSLVMVPPVTLVYGLLISFVVLVYFLLSWKLKIFVTKEVLIASVYAAGVLIGPVSLILIPLNQFVCLLIQIFGLALINLLILSYYEMDFDRQDGQHSWALKFGKEQTEKHIVIGLYTLIAFQVLSMYFMQAYWIMQLLLIAMTLVLMLVFWKKEFFSEAERYRSFSDFVFFIPGLIYWF